VVKHKVIVVEDEEYIRESLRTELDWASLNCKVSKTFPSAEEALTYLENNKVDIVLSDIKMDGMSGLDMGRIIHEKYPGTYILFLTGYGDLEKARKAMRHNAWDFLLKPTRPDELLKSLQKLCKKIENEKKKSAAIAHLEQSVKEAAPVLRQKLLKQLYVEAPYHDKEILGLEDELQRLGHTFTSFHTAQVQIITTLYAAQDLSVQIIGNIISEQVRSKHNITTPILFFQNGTFQLVFLLTALECDAITNHLVKSIKEDKGYTLQIGISSRYYSILKIRESLKESQQALFQTDINLMPAVVFYKNFNSFEAPDDMFSLERIYTIKKFLIYKDEKQISKFLKDFREYLMGFGGRLQSAKGFCFRILVQCEEVLLKAGHSISFDIFSNEIMAATTKEELFSVLKQYIQITSYSLIEIVEKHQDELMNIIDLYVLEHYKDECSINSLAEECSRNEKYLSRHIKKKTGQTFSEYVCRIRISKAEEMLILTGLPVTEVALFSGFKDPAYFSRVFVKYNKCTPREYRKKMANFG
jgi:two-component system, response regulator YesN